MSKRKQTNSLFAEPEKAEEKIIRKEEKIFTVSEYAELLNAFLTREDVRLTGEVTQVKKHVSGHVYFTIKDEKENAVMDCTIWKFNYARSGIDIQVGMELILTGHPEYYAPFGKLSFIAGTIEFKGEGALKKAYDALKKKLAAEGVFAPERKRVLPELARRIGVVTSKDGAVIHDFVNNLGKFGYEISLVDSRVEGSQAVGPLIDAIQLLKTKDIEVLVVIRGGGSLESLQAFNNEALIRELVAFPVPVIAGIGHDQDVPLAALAADFMTSTPTAAAVLINRSWEDAYSKVRQFAGIMGRIEDRIRHVRLDLETALASVVEHTADGIARAKESILHAERMARINNPERQLKLGYSIIRRSGKVMRSVKGLSAGEALSVQMSDGIVGTRVETIE